MQEKSIYSKDYRVLPVYLFLLFEPEDRLLLDDLLLLLLDRVRCTDDPELDLFVVDRTELPVLFVLVFPDLEDTFELLLVLFTETLPLLTECNTADPTLFKKLLPPDRFELW